ncbi:MAG: hypothetical protein UMR38_06550 [Candidatus Izemoplasma sp.]|nr:hypothetical protein [Candidatus Izemoplasma sp.]
MESSIDIIVAFIAGVFTVVVATSNNNSKYITGERTGWRKYVREWISDIARLSETIPDISNFDYCCSLSKNIRVLLEEKKYGLTSKLNPIRDKELINSIKAITYSDLYTFRSIGQGKISDIIDNLEKLLKHDWERVKKNKSFLGKYYLTNIVILTTVFCFLMKTYKYFSPTKIIFDSNMIISLALIILGKFIVIEIEKIVIIRIKATFNLFSSFNLALDFHH